MNKSIIICCYAAIVIMTMIITKYYSGNIMTKLSIPFASERAKEAVFTASCGLTITDIKY